MSNFGQNVPTSRSSSLSHPTQSERYSSNSAISAYSKFIKNDINSQRQRKILSLFKVEKEIVTKKEKKFSLFSLQNSSSKPSVTSPLTNFSEWKRLKNYSFENLIHCAILCIIDGDEDAAIAYLSFISTKLFKKQKSSYYLSQVFMHAVIYNMESVCLFLCEHGFPSDPNASIFPATYNHMSTILGQFTSDLPSFFIITVTFNLISVVKALLKMGANINQSWNGLTPLMIASYKCKAVDNKLSKQNTDSSATDAYEAYDMIRYLLEQGADPHIGIWGGSIELFSKLINCFDEKLKTSNTNLPQQNTNADSNLFMPSKQKTDQNQKLIENELYSKWRSERLIYPITIAVANQDKIAIQILIAKMHQIRPRKVEYILDLQKMQRSYSQSTIDSASSEKITIAKKDQLSLLLTQDLETCLYLLKYNISDPYQVDPHGNNSLHLACISGNIELVNILLHFEEDLINVTGQNGYTPLMEAISNKHLDIFRLLLRKGANDKVKSEQGFSLQDIGTKAGISLNEINEVWLAPVSKRTSMNKDSASTIMPGSVGANELLFNLEARLLKLINGTNLQLQVFERKISKGQQARKIKLSQRKSFDGSQSETNIPRSKSENSSKSTTSSSLFSAPVSNSKRTGTMRPIFKNMFKNREKHSRARTLDSPLPDENELDEKDDNAKQIN